MFNLFKTQTQKQNSDLSGLDFDDALFSIGVGSIEKCREIAMKLFDEGVSCLDDLRSVSEQDAREILVRVGLNKIQENKIIGAIQGFICQVPKVQEPVGRTFYALDCSGSVGYSGSIMYFPILEQMMNTDKCQKNSLFVRWDCESTMCSHTQIIGWIMSKKGYGGTSPICFIKDIPADFGPNDTLIIVSDGQIGSSSAQSFCQAMNARFPFGKKFKQIQVILINTGGAIDKSIVSAFTKYNCPFVLEIYEQNGSLKSREEENYFKLFDKLREMENLSDFTPELRRSIHNLALGCSSTDRIVVELRSEIKRLMRKFQEELDRAPPA